MLFIQVRFAAAVTELHIWPEAPPRFPSRAMTVADVALSAKHDLVRRRL
jgi:hypothetical protein